MTGRLAAAPTPARAVAVTLLLAVAVTLLAGCFSTTPGSDRSAEAGHLSASTLPGAKYVWRPRRAPFFVTHGFVLCRDGEGHDTDLTLDRVAFTARLEPLEAWPVVRTVPAAAHRDGAPGDWAPIGSTYGRPGAFADAVRGLFTEDIRGTRVDETCAGADDPDDARTELDIVVHVPAEGSDIDGFTIYYRIDGRSYELAVPWRMVGCGSRTRMPECETR